MQTSTKSQNLHMMFICAIGNIACMVVTVIPVIGWILGPIGTIVFSILALVALYRLGTEIPGCHTAFILTIVNMVLTFIGIFTGKVSWLHFLLSIAGSILSFLVVYYVCGSVSDLCVSAGDQATADIGKKIVMINLICYGVSILLSIIGLFAASAASVLGAFVSLAQLIAEILYMLFLYRSSKTLA